MLQEVLNDIFTAVGIGVAAGACFLIQRAYTWLSGKIGADNKAALEDAAAKSLAFAIGEAKDKILEHGWDSDKVKTAVVSTATNYALSRFAETLVKNEVDITDRDAAKADLSGMMKRKFPEMAAIAAASPVTPPAALSVAAVASAPEVVEEAASSVPTTAAENGGLPIPAFLRSDRT